MRIDDPLHDDARAKAGRAGNTPDEKRALGIKIWEYLAINLISSLSGYYHAKNVLILCRKSLFVNFCRVTSSSS